MEFSPELAALLPETDKILRAAHLTVHDAVHQVTLEGSRGLAGGSRPDSDIDLTLIVEAAQLPTTEPERAHLLRAVLHTTLDAWRSPIDVDMAAVFDKGGCCGLRCFDQRDWDELDRPGARRGLLRHLQNPARLRRLRRNRRRAEESLSDAGHLAARIRLKAEARLHGTIKRARQHQGVNPLWASYRLVNF